MPELERSSSQHGNSRKRMMAIRQILPNGRTPKPFLPECSLTDALSLPGLHCPLQCLVNRS